MKAWRPSPYSTGNILETGSAPNAMDRLAGRSQALDSGGEGEIRTHEPREGPPVFKTGAFNRSATSPMGRE
jgi:hypothetical protein